MIVPRLPVRPLGRTGLQVTPVGLAALSVRGSGRRGLRLAADDVERAFYDYGINTFLAHFLMPAICEGVRRLIRAGHRDEIILVSEVGIPWVGPVRWSLERHLRSLHTDHLDVWLFGWVRRRWDVRDAVWGELERLRGAGRVRAIGFSSHNRRLAADLVQERDPDVVMIRYNAAHRGAEREVFPEVLARGDRRPGVIAYTATRWGMLLEPVPERGHPRAMTGPECYRFALGHPAVDMAWCAARTTAELGEDVAGVNAGPLAPERLAEVQRFGEAVHAAARYGRRWMFGRTAT